MKEEITLTMDCMVAMCLIGNIQLACRHSANTGPSRKIAENVARHLQEEVSKILPEQAALLEMGWNADFDIFKN